MSEQQLCSAFAAHQRARARLDAAELRTLAAAYTLTRERTEREIDDSARSFPADEREKRFTANLRSLMGSFGLEFRLSDAALTNRAHDAHRVSSQFPAWLTALESAEVGVAHVRAVLKHSLGLADDDLAEFGAEVLRYARGHTARQTDTFAEQLAARLRAAEFARAYELEHAQRRVVIEPAGYGMAWMHAYIPAATAQAIDDLLHQQARALRVDNAARASDVAEPDTRTIAQLCADLFVDTLLTATPQSILESPSAGAARVTATISVVIPVLALRNEPAPVDVARLNGLSPMSIAEAREWAGTATEFERILTHPIDGHVITVDKRAATASLRRYLRARDGTCRFPGCRRAAARCDLDHAHPVARGGPTTPDNLAHLCRQHHVQKHEHAWQVRHLGGGKLEWTSPLGQTLVDVPEPPGPKFVPKAAPPF